jgi:hypothetical protein
MPLLGRKPPVPKNGLTSVGRALLLWPAADALAFSWDHTFDKLGLQTFKQRVSLYVRQQQVDRQQIMQWTPLALTLYAKYVIPERRD